MRKNWIIKYLLVSKTIKMSVIQNSQNEINNQKIYKCRYQKINRSQQISISRQNILKHQLLFNIKMGSQNAKLTYKFVKNIANSTSIQNIYCDENNIQYIGKTMIFSSNQQLQSFLLLCEKRKNIKHNNILNLEHFQSQHEFCSNSIIIYFQYIENNLSTMFQKQKFFAENQILILLRSLILAIAILERTRLIWKWIQLQNIKRKNQWIIDDQSLDLLSKAGQIGPNIYDILNQICPSHTHDKYSKNLVVLIKNCHRFTLQQFELIINNWENISELSDKKKMNELADKKNLKQFQISKIFND